MSDQHVLGSHVGIKSDAPRGEEDRAGNAVRIQTCGKTRTAEDSSGIIRAVISGHGRDNAAAIHLCQIKERDCCLMSNVQLCVEMDGQVRRNVTYDAMRHEEEA